MNTSDRLEHQARRLGLRMVWHAGGQMLVRLGSDDPGVTLVTIEGPQANVSPQDWQRLQAAHPGSVVIGQQYVNPRQAERYRELGIPYLDTAGNAWLDLAGLKIWVEGKPRPVETTPRTPLPRAFTRTGEHHDLRSTALGGTHQTRKTTSHKGRRQHHPAGAVLGRRPATTRDERTFPAGLRRTGSQR